MMIARLTLTTLLLTLCAFTGAGAEEAITVVRVEDLEKLRPQERGWLERNSVLATLIAALLGAAAGAILAYYFANRNAKKAEARHTQHRNQTLQSVLREEIGLAAANIAVTLDMPDQSTPDRLVPALFSGIEHFSVLFIANACDLGLLQKDQLSQLIEAQANISEIRNQVELSKRPGYTKLKLHTNSALTSLHGCMSSYEILGGDPTTISLAEEVLGRYIDNGYLEDAPFIERARKLAGR